MKNFFVLLFLGCALVAPDRAEAAASGRPAPPTVSQVELDRYLGTWHELRRLPNSFQDDHPEEASACFNTTAEYALRGDGKVDVKNTCYREKPNGEVVKDVAIAIARIVDKSGGAKLKVNFTGVGLLRTLGIGDGDYWILGLGPTNKNGLYAWALVGSPRLNFGWILSREPQLAEATLDEILALAESKGYRREQFADPRRP